MPLHDHFSLPLSASRPWEGFYSAWTTVIAQELNRILPAEYVAIPQSSRGSMVEIDAIALELSPASGTSGSALTWSPSQPEWSGTVDWSARDLFEIRIFQNNDNPRVVGAIELISPANKDRPSSRQAFAGKCAGYLRLGIGLIIVDVVTSRLQDLHHQLLELLELDPPPEPILESTLYAVAYRTESREKARLELWRKSLAIASPLPTLPLWLATGLAIPVDLEVSYQASCRMLRIS